MPGYKIAWFQIKSYHDNFLYRDDDEMDDPVQCVVYGTGAHEDHIMDWSGMNYHHGRIPGSPVFKSEEDARAWIIEQCQSGAINSGDIFPGHHSGEYDCCQPGCEERTLYDCDCIYFPKKPDCPNCKPFRKSVHCIGKNKYRCNNCHKEFIHKDGDF